MSTSLLYHCYGLTEQKYLSTEYKENKVIFKVKTKKDKLRCANCGCKRGLIKRGTQERDFLVPPMGEGKRVIVRATLQRLECGNCGKVLREKPCFAEQKKSYTKAFARYINDLCRLMTIKDVSAMTGASWDTIKRIERSYIDKHYGKPRLKDSTHIAIDEFAVQKGHKYMTVVYDLNTCRVLFVGDGKSKEALIQFWKRLRCSGAKIKAVATDMSPAFIGAVRDNLPNAQLIFDRFHITKMINDKLSELRRKLYRDETKLNKRSVIKGTRWLLLKNKDNLDESKDEHLKLEQALQANKPLATAYYLKEELQLLWKQKSVEQAKSFLGSWAGKAYAARVPILTKMANSLLAHRTGIFAWYQYPISTGPLEGLNNKIKVLKRKAYGYRDKEFFKLKILSMHQLKYALSG